MKIPVTHDHTGFTLIELIIVIVLLGILSAVALPRFLDLSTDARRSVNEGIAGALSSSIAAFSARSQMPPDAFSPKPGTQEDPNGYISGSFRAIDMDPNKPSNSAIYLWFAPNGYPVGGSTTASRNTQTQIVTAATDPVITSTDSTTLMAGCNAIFAALLNDSSTQVGSTTGAAPVETAPYAYQSLPLSYVIKNAIPATLGNIAPGQNSSGGANCIWAKTDSIGSTTIFYIFYNQSSGQVASVESSTAASVESSTAAPVESSTGAGG